MTENTNTIPEPTSPTDVVVGKRNGETVVAVLAHDDGYPWVAQTGDHRHCWRSWTGLCRELTDIRVVDMAKLAAQPEPGPWLRGDELEAVMPTLTAGDVVEVEHEGHTATGELWEASPGGLLLGWFAVRITDGKPVTYLDALRIIERAPEPEPGADIPDEVVEAALEGFSGPVMAEDAMRAALAAADAKRAELEGQA